VVVRNKEAGGGKREKVRREGDGIFKSIGTKENKEEDGACVGEVVLCEFCRVRIGPYLGHLRRTS
jgi:hypothetical protein